MFLARAPVLLSRTITSSMAGEASDVRWPRGSDGWHVFSRSVEFVTWFSCMLCLSLQGNFSDKPKDGILISQNVHLFYRRLDIQCALRFTSKEIKGQCTLRRNRVMFGIFGCCIVLCMDTFLICHESINKISKSNENTTITAKLLCPRLAIG